MEHKNRIQEAFLEVGINLSEKQTDQFYQYYEMLIQKNEVMNLTSITEYEEVISKHFVDSVMFCRVIEEVSEASLIDVGTGAGFPGIPLKIVYPQLQITLLDSLNKRVQFLKEVISALGLEGIEAVHGRAEDMARKEAYREQFDFCVSRAVANLASLSEYCIPFVKVGGSFISYKSGKVEEEIQEAGKAMEVLGGSLEEKKDFLLPGSDIYRCLLKIRKKRNTSKKYPRKAGMPTKEPIH